MPRLHNLPGRVIAVCLTLAACASPPVGRKDLLDFLSDGVTRREEVLIRLGEASAQYEASRILAYRIAQDEAGYVVARQNANWNAIRYSLVLVFDADAVLRRHALVDVRAPR